MASIERRVYSLERKLVRERAQLAIRDFVEAVMLRWDDFAASDQDAFFLAHDLGINRIGLPTLPAAVSYLNRCRDEAKTPNPHHLATRLAPWTITPSRTWK